MARYLVTGIEDIDKALAELPNVLANKITRGAMRRGAKKVVEAAKVNLERNSSVDTGLLKKSIVVRAFRGKSKTGRMKTLSNGKTVNIWQKRVGVQIETTEHKKTDDKKGGYAFAVEAGRPKTHPTYEAKPFLRPAIYDNADYIRNEIARDIREQIAMTKANNIK